MMLGERPKWSSLESTHSIYVAHDGGGVVERQKEKLPLRLVQTSFRTGQDRRIRHRAVCKRGTRAEIHRT